MRAYRELDLQICLTHLGSFQNDTVLKQPAESPWQLPWKRAGESPTVWPFGGLWGPHPSWVLRGRSSRTGRPPVWWRDQPTSGPNPSTRSFQLQGLLPGPLLRKVRAGPPPLTRTISPPSATSAPPSWVPRGWAQTKAWQPTQAPQDESCRVNWRWATLGRGRLPTNQRQHFRILPDMDVARQENKQESSCSFEMVLAGRAWPALREARNPVGGSLWSHKPPRVLWASNEGSTVSSKHLVLLRFQQVNELQTRAEVLRRANKSPGQRKRWRRRVGLCGWWPQRRLLGEESSWGAEGGAQAPKPPSLCSQGQQGQDS